MQVKSVAAYISDESRLQGAADRALVVHNEDEIVELLREATVGKIPVTTQGGLTGITGSAVPQGGWVLSLREMRDVLGVREDDRGFALRVAPGCTLEEIRQLLVDPEQLDTGKWTPESVATWRRLCAGPRQMFAPDLTEAGATIGGVVSTNGSGARSYRYGAARSHIEALRLILANGDVLVLKRGEVFARGRSFSVTSQSGRRYAGELPSYQMPDIKHSAGYYVADDMDLLDLFVGAEGTLGIISEIEIRLIPQLDAVCGLTIFLPSEGAALDLVDLVRGSSHDIQAIEYFSAEALDLLRNQLPVTRVGSEIPHLASHWRTAIYVECAMQDDAALDDLAEMLESVGGDMADTWMAEGYQEIQTFKGIRHAIPESVNQWIANQRKRWPEVTKLGTDLAVPDLQMRAVMKMYHEDLAASGLQYVIFGHIGNNHVHVNILPRDHAEWLRGKALYADWAVRVVGMGGTVSAEHGIGKLKVAMLHAQFGDAGIEQMRAVKAVFDPFFLLNRGTLFGAPKSRDGTS